MSKKNGTGKKQGVKAKRVRYSRHSLTEFRTQVESDMANAISESAEILAAAIAETLSSREALPDMYQIRNGDHWFDEDEDRCVAAMARVRDNIGKVMTEAHDFIREISYCLPQPHPSIVPGSKKAKGAR